MYFRFKSKTNLSIIIILLFVVSLSFIAIFKQTILAQSSSEISVQIDQKNKELELLKSNINNIQKEIQSLQSGYYNNQSKLNELNSKISEITSLVNENISKSSEISGLIEQNNKNIFLEQESTKKNINSIYKYSSKHTWEEIFFDNDMSQNSTKKYLGIVLKFQNIKLNEIIKLRDSNISQKQELDTEIEKLKVQKTELATVSESLISKINELNSQIASKANAKAEANNKILGIQTSIKQLSSEQKKAIERERIILENATTSTATIFNKGEFYLEGRGRDLYDGHAIGMSQWGAYGAGKAGMDYKTIVLKYYTGVQISSGYDSRTINVAGYGMIKIEDYVSGLGEIPDFACETEANKGKDYVVKDDPNNAWDCWPEESIKAQVLVARSYALGSISNNPNLTVATDASFQVYKGGKAKKWASDATLGEVVTLNGKVVATYYTASLRGHSEDNELFWTSKSVSKISLNDLKGTAESYLRGIDDSAWSYKNQYYNWTWKTNSLSLSKLTVILKPATGEIGKIVEIQTFRGSSSRIWAMTIIGESGKIYMTGWKFKSLINDYLFDETKDTNYVYSTEFNLIEVK